MQTTLPSSAPSRLHPSPSTFKSAHFLHSQINSYAFVSSGLVQGITRSSHGDLGRLRWFVVRVCSRALDYFLDGFLNKIPVVSFHPEHLDTVKPRDIHEHLPTLLVVDEGYGNANASEASGPANSVKIGLWIGVAEAIVWDVLQVLLVVLT